jgi:molybdenum cofactor synthesis domain-containing protein
VYTVRQAWESVDAAITPSSAENVALTDALGRVVRRDVVADVDWPPFDTSAMDGYAIRTGEAADGAGRRERTGLVAAGDPVPAPLGTGEAVRLMTGAPLPAGADAVVPVEESRREAGRVRFDREPDSGAHLRRRGESVARGTVLLEAGRRLDPAGVALAALAGADPISVGKQPRIAIATTGNELVAARETPREGALRDSNGPMLAALCRARGWRPALYEPVADDVGAVDRLFSESSDGVDFLVTSGGVSAGDLDLLPPAAERAGWEILFHRVSVRPGKPIAFARRGNCFWFGLPGNPVSASACFHLFVRRALDRFEGAAEAGPGEVPATLTRGVPAAGPRETYRDAVLSDGERGRLAEPLESRGSHDLLTHARANALIRMPAGGSPLPAGSVVTCVLLER